MKSNKLKVAVSFALLGWCSFRGGALGGAAVASSSVWCHFLLHLSCEVKVKR